MHFFFHDSLPCGTRTGAPTGHLGVGTTYPGTQMVGIFRSSASKDNNRFSQNDHSGFRSRPAKERQRPHQRANARNSFPSAYESRVVAMPSRSVMQHMLCFCNGPESRLDFVKRHHTRKAYSGGLGYRRTTQTGLRLIRPPDGHADDFRSGSEFMGCTANREEHQTGLQPSAGALVAVQIIYIDMPGARSWQWKTR